MTADNDLPGDVATRARNTQLLVLDVDGVLTDGSLLYDGAGREIKAFNVRDGYGIKELMRAGVEVAIISGRASAAVKERASELGITRLYLGREDKRTALEELCADTGISKNHIACIGDDSPDVPIMEMVGLAVAVNDAHHSASAAAHWSTNLPGGRGAVRELCDLLLSVRTDRNSPA